VNVPEFNPLEAVVVVLGDEDGEDVAFGA